MIINFQDFFNHNDESDKFYGKVKYGMSYLSVRDCQLIYDSEAVCKYVTKHLDKDVDYSAFDIEG